MSRTSLNEGAKPAWPLLLWVPLVAAFALLLSGCAAQSSQPSGEGSQAGESQTGGSRSGEQASRGELGHPALGDAGAPVVMVEYADYQ